MKRVPILLVRNELVVACLKAIGLSAYNDCLFSEIQIIFFRFPFILIACCFILFLISFWNKSLIFLSIVSNRVEAMIILV